MKQQTAVVQEHGLAEVVLEADNLSKKIAGRTIVEQISFAVRRGQIHGFLGPNGAGKTTTIRMLVGLIRPTSGSVRVCGHELAKDFEGAMSKVGCIVEQPDLYRFMTGRENLQHFARMLGLPLDAIEEPAQLVGLTHRLDDLVRTYSLGMRQRLGIAQALLGDPVLLILDEPANGLDPAGIREMRDLLRMLARERGLGILVSSHLLGEVEQICDAVTIIHRGRILASGSVTELVKRDARWDLDCEPVADAMRVLETHHVAGSGLEGGTILFTAEAAQVPILIQDLVEAGVRIRSIAPRRATLEEMFLTATHGESV